MFRLLDMVYLANHYYQNFKALAYVDTFQYSPSGGAHSSTLSLGTRIFFSTESFILEFEFATNWVGHHIKFL